MRESFNHAIARTAVSCLQELEHDVCFHDLYGEGFDPILTSTEIPKAADLPSSIEKHCSEITEAEGIVVVHPNWWGQPPAILKGWIDRVIRPGLAYEFLEGDKGEGVPMGLLDARAVLILNTSNTAVEREINVFGDPLQLLWKNCVFDLCGVNQFHRRMFSIVVTSTRDERAGWLREVRELVESIFPG